jgi:hypothetical protein
MPIFQHPVKVMHTECIDKWTKLWGGAKDLACPLKCNAGLADAEAALLSQASESGSQSIAGFAETQPVDHKQQQEVVLPLLGWTFKLFSHWGAPPPDPPEKSASGLPD